MDDMLSALATYITVLARSTDETTGAEDRSVYAQHLAAAARMFVAAFHQRRSELELLVESERARYGRGYLVGASGTTAESAFVTFARVVSSKPAA